MAKTDEQRLAELLRKYDKTDEEEAELLRLCGRQDVHIVPHRDAKPHKPLPSCPCEPYQSTPVERLDAGDDHVWIHNAWDGREFDEEIDEEERQVILRGLQSAAAGRVVSLNDARPAPAGTNEAGDEAR